MKIFVDFDNTIFDARHDFAEGLYNIFYLHGVNRGLYQKTYDSFARAIGENGELHSPKNHIVKIAGAMEMNINQKVFLQEISEFLENLEEFVFEDFYAFANQYNKKDLIILSYGEYEFQKQKIAGSGIEQFFADTIITQEDKTVEIEKYMQNFPDELVVLIDDKLGYFENAKQSEINIKTVHIVRGDSKCKNSKNCNMHISNLREIGGII
ncbi:MAG: hypothetical protein ACKUBY_00965 [Candidatus Moraniibacteriota bacterium]|jgi:FMN phosphatase YigB (HAD superfamily)